MSLRPCRAKSNKEIGVQLFYPRKARSKPMWHRLGKLVSTGIIRLLRRASCLNPMPDLALALSQRLSSALRLWQRINGRGDIGISGDSSRPPMSFARIPSIT